MDAHWNWSCHLRRFGWSLMMLAAMLTWSGVAGAETAAPAQPEAKVDARKITGTLTSVTKRSISVEYVSGDESNELLLPLTAETTFSHVQGLAELKVGDTVSVGYQRTYRDGESGEPFILKTIATDVTLVKRAMNALGSRGGATP